LIIAPAAEGHHMITLEFVAPFLAGLLAGIEVAVRFGVREIRTCAAVLAFACFLTSAALQLAAN
jgi:tetrahydromethanopterin S-methyltransferase subunit D